MPFMFKKLTFTFFLILFICSSQGQEIESLLDSTLGCKALTYSAMELISENSVDNVGQQIAALNFKEQHCGKAEWLFRTRVLLSISTGSFSEIMLDSYPVLSYLMDYKSRIKEQEISHPNRSRTLKYDSFTKSLAERISKSGSLSPLESFFVKYYSNLFDGSLNAMEQEGLFPKKVRIDYGNRIKTYKNMSRYIAAVNYGWWIPSGNLAKLGSHNTLGFYFGTQKNKWAIVGNVDYFLTNSSEEKRTVNRYGTLYESKYLKGERVGANIRYSLINDSKFSLIASLGGVGTSFVILNEPTRYSDNNLTFSTGSIGLQFGGSIRYRVIKNAYVTLRCAYVVESYKNDGGSNLDGNSMNIGLSFGYIANKNRSRGLNYLDYPDIYK
jgi:hypothetical protein